MKSRPLHEWRSALSAAARFGFAGMPGTILDPWVGDGHDAGTHPKTTFAERSDIASWHPTILDLGSNNVMLSWPNQLFINGEWVDSASRKNLERCESGNGPRADGCCTGDADDVDLAVTAARRAFDEGEWPHGPLVRGRLLFRLAERIRDSLNDLAMTDTLNIGKPIRDTPGFDVPCAADLFESYAGLPEQNCRELLRMFADNMTMQIYEPMGVIAAIAPGIIR